MADLSIKSGSGYRDGVKQLAVADAAGYAGIAGAALYDQFGNVVTSLRVSAGGPASGQVQKNFSGTYTLAGATATIPLETVSTGRTLYITDIFVTVAGAAGSKLCAIQAGGAQIAGGHVTTAKGLECPGIETQPFATAGVVVQLALSGFTAADVLCYNIYAFEQ